MAGWDSNHNHGPMCPRNLGTTGVLDVCESSGVCVNICMFEFGDVN